MENLTKEQVAESVKVVKEANPVERVNMGYSQSSMLVKALNNQGIRHEGKKATVLKAETSGDDVVLHLNVNGKYVKDVLTDTAEVLRLKSQVDFVWDASRGGKKLALNATTTPSKIYSLVESIGEYDIAISEEDKAMLDKALTRIVGPLGELMPKVTVLLQEEAEKSGGNIELVGDTGNIYLGSSKKLTDRSVYESFVHELYHAVTAYGLAKKDPETVKVRKEIETLRDAFMESKEAQKVYKESLPDKDNAERDLERALDYFADPEVGLYEFIANGVTNPALVKALGTLQTKGKEEVYPNLAAKLVGIVRRLFNGLIDKVQRRPTGNDAVQMAWLVDRLVHINEKQVDRKKDGIMSKLERWADKNDSFVAGKIEKQKEKMANKPVKMPTTRLGKLLNLPRSVLRASYDDKMKSVVASSFSLSTFMDGTSTVPTLLRHGTGGNENYDKSIAFGMVNQYYDTEREAIRRQTRDRLKANFDRVLGVAEFKALDILLSTDFESIMDDHELVDLLDSKKLDKKIAEVEKSLAGISDEKELRYFKHQSKLLSDYMVTGKDNILLLKNAKNIAMRVNSIGYKTLKADETKVKLIDELVSLYAFRLQGKESKELLKEIIKEEETKSEGLNGIAEVMYTIGGMKASADKNLFSGEKGVSQQIKGYRTDVFSSDVDMIVAPVGSEGKLKREGYKMVHKVNNHKSDSSGEQALFVSEFPIKKRMHKVGMRYKNLEARGSSFSQSHYRDGDKNGALMAERDIKRARNEMYKKIKAVENGTYKAEDDDTKISPRFNENGEILDFNYSMDLETKREVLGAEVDTLNVIGSTAASNYDKVVSVEHNKKVIDLILEEAEVNASKYRGDKIIGKKDNNVYVWVGPNSVTAKRKDLWQVFPDEGKHLFRNSDDEPSGFYIRESLQNNLLGFREKDVTDLPLMSYTSNRTKYVMRVVEEIMAALVKIYKGQILLRMPEVLLLNIMSNFNSMLMYKVSPLKVMKYKLNAVKDLTDYIALSKEKVGLTFKIESGKASKEEERRLKVIQNKMEMSSVKDLMDAGFYNQIMEDIEGDETGNIVKDWVGAKTEKLPEIVKNGAGWVWLSDSNPVVKFMETSTQYSDFVARYALHNLLVNEKGKSKEESIKTVRNLFVPYTNANSPWLEWGNKMGGVMFTKYFTNIQRAIMELGRGHPITFLTAMLGQNIIMDVPDITDASVFTKDLGNLLYNPGNAMLSAAMPGSYIMYDSIMN